MIRKKEERVICDICERNITNHHIYPKKHGFKWLFSERTATWWDWRKEGFSHHYSITEMDFCGDCWEEIVETVKEKRGQ